MPIRYDSLLVRYLAAELDARLARRPVTALFLSEERRRLEIHLGEEALVWALHPARGGGVRLRAVPGAAGAAAEAGRTGGIAGSAPASAGAPGQPRLPRKPAIRSVRAVPDDRVLVFELGGAGAAEGRARRVVVELMPNALNALAVDGTGRILDAVQPRRAGGRRLRRGARYAAPEPTGREGVDGPVSRERWRDLLDPVAPEERVRALVAALAYVSPINAQAILGAAGESAGEGAPRETDAAGPPGEPAGAGPPDGLDAAYDRYAAIASMPPAAPCVLELESGPQPYPLPLPGVPASPEAGLLDAIARTEAAAADAETDDVAEAPAAVAPALLARLDARLRGLGRRVGRLREELEGAGPEAAALRERGDLLLSNLHRLRKGLDRVELPDFTGATRTLELDPALTPVDNANRFYDAAKKRERAAARLPAMIRRAEAERDALAAVRDRALAGEADAAEVETAAGAARARGPRGARGEDVAPPYRRYRTSGGLEVRVGRGRRWNDELTFHHSSPDDVWLHARDAAGAHVILRWPDREANPPARDLREAAVLAALHSRARTSGTVAVDWTRRKYVRKPRKAPPGLVVPERVGTLFVEPDPRTEERMREGEAGPE